MKRKRGGQPGNKNAVGHGAPLGNKNAYKHGIYVRYPPHSMVEKRLLEEADQRFRERMKEQRAWAYQTLLDMGYTPEEIPYLVIIETRTK